MENRRVDGIEVQRGSGDVYADLGLPDAEKLKIKIGLVIKIRKAMRALAIWGWLLVDLCAGSRSVA